MAAEFRLTEFYNDNLLQGKTTKRRTAILIANAWIVGILIGTYYTEMWFILNLNELC